MRHRPGFQVSLARKVSLLFGSAVLLTITATLTFPWQQMMALQEEALLQRAKQAAFAAHQAVDLVGPDWNTAQSALEFRWPEIVRGLGLPLDVPQLISARDASEGFQREATDRLMAGPDLRYYWRSQSAERSFRFAMAVRGESSDTHPRVLRGIIDVRLPMPEEQGVWNWLVTVLAGASGAVLAILVFYLVTQRLVLSPVNELRRVAERVTSGDIQVRSTISSHDEFRELSDAFNEMLAHLKAAQEEQEKINRSLDVRLEELAQLNVTLHESSRLKSEFLANVTHELRTPLVSIIGFAELLRDVTETTEVDRKRLTRFSQNILSSGRSLLELINDLLDLAKIEANKLELHLSEFSIAELCQDLVDFVRPLADKQKQHLHLRVEPELPRCRSDAGRIKQILYNLLSNAVKFTPPEGTISVSVARDVPAVPDAGGRAEDDGCVRISVRDSGPGIPKEHQAKMFEKFRQLDSSATREYAGTGLGLAITKELVDMLGGAIELESEEGAGCDFTVRFPVIAKTDHPRPKVRLA